MQQLNRERFEVIFRTEFKGLCYLAQKVVKDPEAAREIVQEAFVNLWEKRDSIDQDRNIRSYLATGIYNRSLNWLRDNRKFNVSLLELENLSDTAGIESVDNDNLAETELHELIQKSINELPEKCREVFVLSRYENMKYKEIADQLDISVKTVEAQMSKALQHLRLRLADYIRMIMLIILTFKQ